MSLPDLRDPSAEAGSSNPYAPPSAPLEDAPLTDNGLELADRGLRFGAQFCDGFITGIPSALLAFGAGVFAATHFPGDVIRSSSAQWALRLLGVAIYVTVFIAINGWLLAKRGQTVGKKICGIRISRPDGSVPSLSRSFGLRVMVLAVPGLLPFPFALAMAYGVRLLDVLFIFRGNRKCLHDEIAGTIVVKA